MADLVISGTKYSGQGKLPTVPIAVVLAVSARERTSSPLGDFPFLFSTSSFSPASFRACQPQESGRRGWLKIRRRFLCLAWSACLFPSSFLSLFPSSLPPSFHPLFYIFLKLWGVVGF